MGRQEKNIEIVELLKQGKEKVFRAIFNTYFEPLVVFAKVYVLDKEVAKDIVQDVFYNLWKVRTTLSEKTNLKALLYQMTRNNCLNYLKRIKVQKKYENKLYSEYIDLSLNQEALEKLNFDRFEFDELFDVLNNGIRTLPARCREVFELSRYDGMKNREIAEELNISLKAVEGHISKALKQLKEYLNKHYLSKILLLLFVRAK